MWYWWCVWYWWWCTNGASGWWWLKATVSTRACTHIFPTFHMELPNLCLELYRCVGLGQLHGTTAGGLALGAWKDGWGWADTGLLCSLRDAGSKEEALAIVDMAWECNRWGKSKEAEQLARVGTSGEYKQTAQRDIFRAARNSGLVRHMPDLYYFKARGPSGTRATSWSSTMDFRKTPAMSANCPSIRLISFE